MYSRTSAPVALRWIKRVAGTRVSGVGIAKNWIPGTGLSSQQEPLSVLAGQDTAD